MSIADVELYTQFQNLSKSSQEKIIEAYGTDKLKKWFSRMGKHFE